MKDETMTEELDLVEVDAAEIRELLSQVDAETREAALFAIGLCNLPPIVAVIPNPSQAVH
jgi:hypothetical protein